MRVNVPQTNSPVTRILATLPSGNTDKYDSTTSATAPIDIVLPDGVSEDQVELSYVGVGNNGKPVGEPILMKARVAPEPARITTMGIDAGKELITTTVEHDVLTETPPEPTETTPEPTPTYPARKRSY